LMRQWFGVVARCISRRSRFLRGDFNPFRKPKEVDARDGGGRCCCLRSSVLRCDVRFRRIESTLVSLWELT
jgi:hypothetical protein